MTPLKTTNGTSRPEKERKKSRPLAPLLFDLDVAPDVVADLTEIVLHPLTVLVVDDLQQLLQFGADLRHLVVGVGIEKNFLQQDSGSLFDKPCT